MTAENELSEATSPYLLQHAQQKVHWRQWGVRAFDEARRRHVPVFLSIGYAACHWCHVMAHESFDDPATARMLNDGFVSIKVDREERPDIDQIYMASLQAMGEHGGWPLTMFLTPEAEAFWGGTYFPPDSRWGRPGFREVLAVVSAAFARGDTAVHENARRLGQALHRLAASEAGGVPTDAMVREAGHRLTEATDPIEGGLKGSPKFPNFPVFHFLAQRAARGDAAAGGAVAHFLRALCRGGIFDHVAGGLFRYATDGIWLVPHFEKMLYDNGQFLTALALEHARKPDPALARAASMTVGFLRRELEAGAAFAASLDADSEGEEGAFYVWTAAQIDAALGDRGADFGLAFGVTPAGNWEGRTVLHRTDLLREHGFESERAALLAARGPRPRPGLDDKVLADWNGLAIAGLCRAAAVFGNPGWLEDAARAFAQVDTVLRRDGRLCHAWRAGRIGAAGLLDDHGALTLAALALHAGTGEDHYLDRARALVAEAQTWFGPAAEGFYMTAADADDLPATAPRPRSVNDGATPSGSGMMAEALARLYHLTGEAAFEEQARAAIRALSGALNPFAHASLLAAAELLEAAQTVVVIGDPGLPAAQSLAGAALAAPDPATVVLRRRSGLDLAPLHPAYGKTAPDGQALAYLCRRGVCRAPIADPGLLAAALREGGSAG